jgi:hypothetical protein
VTALWIGGSASFAQITPGNDIPSFVGCLDKALDPNVLQRPGNANGNANVSDAVQCIPDGCKITVTMSDQSAQAACFADPIKFSGQLPRVILSCPGPVLSPWRRIRPSFLLCPRESAGGSNRIEIGGDQQPILSNKATVNMQMADVSINPRQRWDTSADFKSVLSITSDNPATNKACNGSCHTSGTGDPIIFNAKQTKTINSLIIDPFGYFANKAKSENTVYLQQFIIETTEPNKKTLVKPNPPYRPQTLAQVCNNILGADVFGNPINDTLCNKLREYQAGALRRSDGSVAKPCGKSGDPAIKLVCGGINGGGMFNDTKMVPSVISVDVSGQARNNNDGTFSFLDTDGTLTAYNYGTRTMLTSVAITSIQMLNNGAKVSGNGQGQITINGTPPPADAMPLGYVPFTFEIDNIKGGDLTFNLVFTISTTPMSIGGTIAKTPPGTKVIVNGFN